VTTIVYDTLGRTARVFLPDDQASPNPSYRFVYSIPQPGNTGGLALYTTSEQKQKDAPVTYQFSRTFLDGMGRARETHGPSPAGLNAGVVSYSRYDDRGKLKTQMSAFPHDFGATPLIAETTAPIASDAAPSSLALYQQVSTTSTYDSLGRPAATRQWSGTTLMSTTTMAYFGRHTYTYPDSGQHTVTRTDAYGRVDITGEGDTGCCTGDVATALRGGTGTNTNTMVVFGIGVEGDLWRKAQMWVGGPFGDWIRMSVGGGYTRVAATTRQDGRLAVAVINTGGVISTFAETVAGSDSFTGATTANGAYVGSSCCITVDIALTTTATGNLWVFGINVNGSSYHTYETSQGVWAAWAPLSNAGSGLTRIAATRFPDNRVAVAVQVNNGDVWAARQTTAGVGQPFSNMVNAPTGGVTDIDLDVTTNGTLFLVGIGGAGVVYQRYESSPNTWSSWAAIGNTGAQNISTEHYRSGQLVTITGYAAGSLVQGSTQGTLQINTQTAAAGAFTSDWYRVERERYTFYGYDALGNQTSITDPNGNVTAHAYDYMSRKIATASADKRTVAEQTLYSYTIGTDGLTSVTVTDPTNKAIKTSSDILGRPTQRADMNGTVPGGLLATWTYGTATNGKGRLASASSCNGTSTTSCGSPVTTSTSGYDTRGRPDNGIPL
jgi:YD repeat-containing protein